MDALEQTYMLYQWVVLAIAIVLLGLVIYAGINHARHWYIYAIAGIYLFTTAVMYLLFLGVGREWEIAPVTMMGLSAILRIQGLVTVGLLAGVITCCIGKTKWKISKRL